MLTAYVTGSAPLVHLDFERQAGGGFANEPTGGFDAKVEGNITQDSEGIKRSASFDGKSYLTIAVGCTGGRHRSVFCTRWLAQNLRSSGHPVQEFHRDIVS